MRFLIIKNKTQNSKSRTVKAKQQILSDLFVTTVKLKTKEKSK